MWDRYRFAEVLVNGIEAECLLANSGIDTKMVLVSARACGMRQSVQLSGVGRSCSRLLY